MTAVNRAKTNDLHALTCPMRGCGEQLVLTWALARPLFLADIENVVVDDEGTPTPDSAHTGTWRVECASGHVLLLPDPTGCPCPPQAQDGPACPHDPDDYEWDEDGPQTFRRTDLDRLVALMDTIEGPRRAAA
ncbi:hypothetical protein [Nocardioides pakistanensis]